MEKKPLVSVIVPCFNSERWIHETLGSIFDQSYPNIEVIVVDDGSTDNTKSIVENYTNKVMYYYQKNKGPSAARNLGLKKANGEYIAFLDSDDLWEKEKLSEQIQFLEKNRDVHLVFSNVTVMNEEGVCLYIHSNKVPIDREQLVKKLFLGQITMNTPTITARKESVISVGGFDEKLPLREDHFFLMLMAHEFKVFHFTKPLVKRRVNEKSMSNTVNADNIFDLNEPFILKSFDKFPYLAKYRRNVYSRLCMGTGKGYWKTENRKKSLKYMVRSLYYDPIQVRNYIFVLFVLSGLSYSKLETIKRSVRTKIKS
ncbi:glycosyltransferase family 2 protein [Alteribacter natronophilus]|uniref:glycosyltransferase family 2 protein n=1 Tax=Alteribacter natronophilus TaxID=2583810 RepID=UPI001485F52C|nr:glycosyltransferase [Alteribacter natronophilus]